MIPFRLTELRAPPYYANYSKFRLYQHNVVTSKYFDLAIALVIGLNVVTMAMEYYLMEFVRMKRYETQKNKSKFSLNVISPGFPFSGAFVYFEDLQLFFYGGVFLRSILQIDCTGSEAIHFGQVNA